MSRISEAFQNKKTYIGFLTAGDPSLEKTEEYIVEMERAGAGIIEIGIPFSDPIAEGPVVQDANVRALSVPGGCTTDMIFDMVARVREKVSVPFVFLAYLNQVFKYGYEEFFSKCKEVGVDGIIIPDLTYEEKDEIVPTADKYGVDVISLIAITSADRIPMIAKEARGYIYVISSGDDAEMATKLQGIRERIREVSDLPIAVEVSIESPAQAAEYSSLADGVIAETGIVNIIAKHGVNASKHIYYYVKSMVDALQQK